MQKRARSLRRLLPREVVAISSIFRCKKIWPQQQRLMRARRCRSGIAPPDGSLRLPARAISPRTHSQLSCPWIKTSTNFFTWSPLRGAARLCLPCSVRGGLH